jgi:hypothetical protein
MREAEHDDQNHVERKWQGTVVVAMGTIRISVKLRPF